MAGASILSRARAAWPSLLVEAKQIRYAVALASAGQPADAGLPRAKPLPDHEIGMRTRLHPSAELKAGIDSLSRTPQISVVIPMYNEEPALDALLARLLPVLERTGLSYEVICVNDGSKDQTLERVLSLRAERPSIKLIDLSRNFGKDTALTAGLDFARGAAVVSMDADLQHPPEIIETLLARWRDGYEIVTATRRAREGEPWLRRLTGAVFQWLMNAVSDVRVHFETSDFRLLDRRVVDALGQLPERTRLMKGLYTWVGYRRTEVLYDSQARAVGTTKWNYWRLWNYGIDGVVSFSSLPLKLWSYIGLVISLLAFVYAGWLVLRVLIHGRDVPGFASVMVAVLFLGGIQLLSLGIIGEYLARVYSEVKHRPLYLIRGLHGFEASRGAVSGREP